ncbi:MAG: glycosyltransferase [Candidatus Aenigmarchaeota archaeon]|nr:glycosyltransferase [Candidatus Aenigmarchaeota archaeon]
MKIAFFTDTYKPQVNGVVTSIELFSRQLQKEGHEVHIFAPTGYGKKVHKMPSFGFSPYPGYRIGIPLSEKLLWKFKEFNFDIIHVHTPISLGAVGIGMAKHLDIPVVGTFHTMLPEYMHYLGKLMGIKGIKSVAKKGAWKYCAWFHNRLNAVMAPSEQTARVLKRHGVKKPVIVVPTGIDMRRIGNAKKKREKSILHVGRITREKSIETIIDALAELPEEVTLRIASSGPHAAELRKYVIEKGLKKRVKFLGYLSNEELDREYKSAGVFVIASKTETQALVLLEAALRGLPVVALEAPVTGDFVRENQIGIVSKKDELPRNITQILHRGSKNSSDLQRLMRKYDIKNCTKMLLEVYESVIS